MKIGIPITTHRSEAQWPVLFETGRNPIKITMKTHQIQRALHRALSARVRVQNEPTEANVSRAVNRAKIASSAANHALWAREWELYGRCSIAWSEAMKAAEVAHYALHPHVLPEP